MYQGCRSHKAFTQVKNGNPLQEKVLTHVGAGAVTEVHRGWLREKGDSGGCRTGCPGKLHQSSNYGVDSCPEDESGRAFQESGPARQRCSRLAVPVSQLSLSMAVTGLGESKWSGESSHFSLSSRHWSNPGQAQGWTP